MKHSRAARLTATAILAAGSSLVLTLPSNANAENIIPTVTPTVESAAMMEAMTRDLGLSEAQATQRLESESVARTIDEAVRAELGDSFGGSYFDAEANTLVVGVTDASRVDDIRTVGARATLVDDTVAELTMATDQLDRTEGTAPDAVTGWYVDVESNSVVVTTAVGAMNDAERFVDSAGVDRDTVTIVESTESPQALMDVIGGNPYYLGSGGRCSIGFSVQGGGFVTAGHCGSTGETTSWPSGRFVASSFPGNDYAVVDTGSDDTVRPWVNMHNGYARVVSGSQESPVGFSVCRSGSTTGWHCGTIEAKNQTVRYSQGTVYGLTRTNVCAEPGDSGGSFISGNQAQGMTSGGSGNCTYGGTTYFQPVNEVLNAYGLRLVTG